MCMCLYMWYTCMQSASALFLLHPSVLSSLLILYNNSLYYILLICVLTVQKLVFLLDCQYPWKRTAFSTSFVYRSEAINMSTCKYDSMSKTQSALK